MKGSGADANRTGKSFEPLWVALVTLGRVFPVAVSLSRTPFTALGAAGLSLALPVLHQPAAWEQQLREEEEAGGGCPSCLVYPSALWRRSRDPLCMLSPLWSYWHCLVWALETGEKLSSQFPGVCFVCVVVVCLLGFVGGFFKQFLLLELKLYLLARCSFPAPTTFLLNSQQNRLVFRSGGAKRKPTLLIKDNFLPDASWRSGVYSPVFQSCFSLIVRMKLIAANSGIFQVPSE